MLKYRFRGRELTAANHVELLIRLGLSFTQAKIYLALCTAGTCTARAIAENSGVAREVIYQIIPTLQEKGLVETVITTPRAYRAIPAENAFEILLKHQDEEKSKLKKEVKETLKTLKQTQKGPFEECPHITMVPKGKALISKILNELKNAQESVDIIISWPIFMKWHHLYIRDEISETLKRNVRIRMLAEKNLAETKASPLAELVLRTSYFDRIDFRIAKNTSLVNMIIFDDRKVFIDAIADKALQEMPSLFSNNPSILQVATSCFQNNWEKTSPLKVENKKSLMTKLSPLNKYRLS